MDIKRLIRSSGTKGTTEDYKALKKIREGRDREVKAVARGKINSKQDLLNNRLNMIYDFSRGIDLEDLSTKYNYTYKDIHKAVNKLLEDLLNIKESRVLEDNKYKKGLKGPIQVSIRKLKDYKLINEDFLSLLSEDDSKTLSEEESLFSYLYVYRGDAHEGLEASGLSTGLIKGSESYRKALTIRAAYLKEKPNVASYIQRLREERYVTTDVTKDSVQSMLLEELAVMKERGDVRDRVNIRQTIELLGKTIGAFTERVEIHEVDPSTSLDLLIEMAKEAETKELT